MILCCLTTYNPDPSRLENCIVSIKNQVDKLILIDNNSNNIEKITPIIIKYNIDCIRLDKNIGIACAQNIVWKNSIDLNYEHIVFSDQDTIFPANYIKTLLNILSKYKKCAAISPVYKDVHSNETIQPSVNIFSKPSKFTLQPSESVKVSHAISSGLIVRNKFSLDIGLNDEFLFIDWVDTEWCWRAHEKGYTIIQTGSVALEHALGEDRINLAGHMVTRHKLFRSYYKIRNGIYLTKKFKDIKIRKHLIYHTLKNIILTFYSHGSLSNKLKTISKAIFDGARKRGGIYG